MLALAKNIFFGVPICSKGMEVLEKSNTTNWSDYRKETFILKLKIDPITKEPQLSVRKAKRAARDQDRAHARGGWQLVGS